MRKSGLTGDEAYVLSKHGKTTEDLGLLKKEIGLLKEDLSNKITKFYASNQGETHITDSDNGKIQDMMLYGKSSQDGTPSPENPVEIKSVVNPTIKICGKNLFDSKKFPIILNRAISGSTGNIYVSSSGNYCAIEKYMPFPYSGKKISFNASMSLYAYDQDYKYISIINKHNGQVPSGTIYVRFDIKVEDKDKVQIELSENTTTYEPYKEQTIQLPITLNAIPVSSGGNVTINGQQYIADYVDVERGKVVRMCKYKKLLSTNITDLTDLTSNKVMYIKTDEIWDAEGNYIYRNIGILYSIGIASLVTVNDSGWKGKGKIVIKNVQFAHIDEAKNYFDNNDVYACYPIPTPEEIPITLEEASAFKQLMTYYPVTNISVNSEQVEGYTVFNYPISMANGWNYVKQQLNDNRDYIYDMDLQLAEAYVNSEYAVTLTELEV